MSDDHPLMIVGGGVDDTPRTMVTPRHDAFEGGALTPRTPRSPMKAMRNWSTEEVADFVRNLGKGKKWIEYAMRCLEVDVDGATLKDATVDILQEIGFHRIHANRVLKEAKRFTRRPITASDRKKPFEAPQHLDESLAKAVAATNNSSLGAPIGGAPSKLPLTETEEKQMIMFGRAYDFLIDSERTIEGALVRLEGQKAKALEASDTHFDRVEDRIQAARVQYEENINAAHDKMCEDLLERLNLLRAHKDLAYDQSEKLQKVLKKARGGHKMERKNSILRITEPILKESLPLLKNKPKLLVQEETKTMTTLRTSNFVKVSGESPEFVSTPLSNPPPPSDEIIRNTMPSSSIAMKEETKPQRPRREGKSTTMSFHEPPLDSKSTANDVESIAGGVAGVPGSMKIPPLIVEPPRKALLTPHRFDDTDATPMISSIGSIALDTENPGRWERLPDFLKTGRFDFGLAVSPDMKYLFAVGGDAGRSTPLNTTEVMTIDTCKWGLLPVPMHSKRSGLAAAISQDGKYLYAVGGIAKGLPSNTVEVYDFSSQRWAFVPWRMNYARYGHGLAMAKDGSRMYAVGGVVDDAASDTVEYYDFEAKRWEILPGKMTVPRANLGVVLSPDGNRLYAIGGRSEIDTANQTLNTAEVYEFKTRKWTRLPGQMKRKRAGLGVAISNVNSNPNPNSNLNPKPNLNPNTISTRYLSSH